MRSVSDCKTFVMQRAVDATALVGPNITLHWTRGKAPRASELQR
jgi:hypothetical protein